MFDMRLSYTLPYTFWAGLIGGAVLTVGTHGTDHSMVQRYLSARNERQAGLALFLSGLVVFVQFALFLFIGIELACFFGQHAGSEAAALKLRPDQVFAHFIVNHYPRNTGLIGLMLAAILASNLSSSLSASAAAVVNDLYLPWRKTPLESGYLLGITRGLTVAFGVLQIVLGILAERLYAADSTVVKGANHRGVRVRFAAGRVCPRCTHAPHRPAGSVGGNGNWARRSAILAVCAARADENG